MYVCMYVRMYVFMYVCMYVHIYVCMYVCMYVHTYVCMYVCMYVSLNEVFIIIHMYNNNIIYNLTVHVGLMCNVYGSLLYDVLVFPLSLPSLPMPARTTLRQVLGATGFI